MSVLALGYCVGSSCAFPTDTGEPEVDLRGAWAYSGRQVAPAVEISGTLAISSQAGASLTGQLGWEERNATGGIVTFAGPVSGRLIGASDVDFDVQLEDRTRRHVGRISANGDTISGAWVSASDQTGNFLLVRGSVR